MKAHSCPFEAEVREAFLKEEWSPELRDHLIDCEDCADVVLVQSYLTQVEEQVAEDVVPVIDPGLIWRRAQLAKRVDANRRATLPIKIVSWIAGLCGLLVAAVGFLFFLPNLRRGADSVWSMWSVDSLPSSFGNPTPVLLASAAVLLFAWLADQSSRWTRAS